MPAGHGTTGNVLTPIAVSSTSVAAVELQSIGRLIALRREQPQDHLEKGEGASKTGALTRTTVNHYHSLSIIIHYVISGLGPKTRGLVHLSFSVDFCYTILLIE